MCLGQKKSCRDQLLNFINNNVFGLCCWENALFCKEREVQTTASLNSLPKGILNFMCSLVGSLYCKMTKNT